MSMVDSASKISSINSPLPLNPKRVSRKCIDPGQIVSEWVRRQRVRVRRGKLAVAGELYNIG